MFQNTEDRKKLVKLPEKQTNKTTTKDAYNGTKFIMASDFSITSLEKRKQEHSGISINIS